MSQTDYMDKLKIFLTANDRDRISIEETTDGILAKIDVHGLTCLEAKRIINSLIACCRIAFTLEVNHGYNSGTSIKQMIVKDKFNDRFGEMLSPHDNPGITIIHILSC